MAMTGFICHDDYYNRIQRLTDEEVGHLFRQLMLYHAGRYDEMEDFVGSEGIAFDFIASDIDRMEEKQTATSETNRINGSKGGRPKKQNKPEETEENPNKPNETEENPTKAYKDKDKDKDKVIKESVREKEPPKRFTPPTRDEVQAYCTERGNNVDVDRFVDFYTAKGWMVGRNPMKDWKAAVRTWEKSQPLTVVRQPNTATTYGQRDYSGEQEKAFDSMMERIRQRKAASQ